MAIKPAASKAAGPAVAAKGIPSSEYLRSLLGPTTSRSLFAFLSRAKRASLLVGSGQKSGIGPAKCSAALRAASVLNVKLRS